MEQPNWDETPTNTQSESGNNKKEDNSFSNVFPTTPQDYIGLICFIRLGDYRFESLNLDDKFD